MDSEFAEKIKSTKELQKDLVIDATIKWLVRSRLGKHRVMNRGKNKSRYPYK